jgi:hypothetical protein
MVYFDQLVIAISTEAAVPLIKDLLVAKILRLD